MNNEHAAAYFSLIEATTLIEKELKHTLAEYDLTHGQLNILSILFANKKKPLSLKEVKSRLIVATGDISRLIERLVKKDLVTRSTCPENRRKVNIRISELGVKIYAEAHRKAKATVKNYFGDVLSIKEAKSLNKVLAKIKNSIT